jgi:hypothetical protein
MEKAFGWMKQTGGARKTELRQIQFVMSKLRLALHPEKTRLVNLRLGQGSFVLLGCTIGKKGSIQRRAAEVLHATVAVAQGYEANPATRARVNRGAAKREGREADHRTRRKPHQEDHR